MKLKQVTLMLMTSAAVVLPGSAFAQQAAQPAGQGQLPPVDVIQKQKAAPAKKAAKAAPKKQAPVTSPAPVAAPEEAFDEPPAGPVDPNPIYGAQNSGGAAQRAATGTVPPINGTSILPSSLENFAGAGTIVTNEALAEQQQPNTNEIFKRVPGVIVVNDDGNAHHGGIGIRGSAPRRSRKVLVMEDGHAVNLALWLDPSVHYYAPIDRIEGVEVIRGTVTNFGPNNNFGVVNIRNLSPFGPDETVISAEIGFTRNEAGFFEDEDGEITRGNSDTDTSGRWHVHTRKSVDNVGLVLSYTGADVQGAWDNERLRFHDLYGAVGWKGIDKDLTMSLVYARQRDKYDESNLEGEESESGTDNLGEVEEAFFKVKHCKTCFSPGSDANNYNGDIWRGQIVHNYFVDDDTTVTTRLYAGHHRRDRYQIVTLGDNPFDPEEEGIEPVFVDDEENEDLSIAVFGEDSMFGRLRTFRHLGTETRAEWANRAFVSGMSQDIQAGIRYEYQDMTNRNFLGESGEVLEDGDEDGLTIFERNLRANTVSAFLQSNVHVTQNFNVIPGVRFEWYNVNRQNYVTSEEEGEAEEGEEDGFDCEAAIDEEECLIIEGINRNPFRDGTDTFEVLPALAFSYTGFHRTVIFGGYHRGLSTGVLRNEDFPAPDEIGDNFQLGFRTAAVHGVTAEVVGFYNRLKDFQFGQSFSTTAGDRSFGRADEVSFTGVELYGRLDSHPYIGGPLNVFAEGNYSYTRAVFEEGVVGEEGEEIDLSGNRLPEVPFHLAALTLGVEGKTGWRWNASATYTYRDGFFTDELNTAFGGDEEGENGEVPSVWLLSARANLYLGDSGASVFVSGENLTDELYITDREDGLKPGQGRTVWTGFKQRF